MGLRGNFDKLRNAGFVWSARAIRTRMLRKIQSRAALRGYFDRRWRVTPESLLDCIDFGAATGKDLRACFIDGARARHFLQDVDATAAVARSEFPEAVAATLAIADGVCGNTFRLLGQSAGFNERIDWGWLPGTTARWPRLHAEAYPKSFYNRADRPGDVKYPWELNRHQYFVTLGKAYRYTRDEKYVQTFCTLLLDWIEQNPFREGINWTSEMELGIRMLSWCNAFQFFKDAPYFQQHALAPFMTALYQHASYLRRRLTTGWLAANNHLLGETAGLFAFSVLFPQFKDSAEFRRAALAIFSDALERQIFADGVNREQATGYHRFVLDFIWVVVRLGELNGISIPRIVYQRMEQMLAYEAALVSSDGTAPQVGDCDDGRGIALSESVSLLDYRGWLAAGAMQFERPALLQTAGQGNEETLWLLGVDTFQRISAMVPAPDRRGAACFSDGGHCVLRAAARPEAAEVFVRCGEFGLGQDGSSTHSHGDILAPVIYMHGCPFAVDAGTYGYLIDSSERDRFRSTSLHNTMAPRGREQARMFPLWGWGKVPQSRIVDWHADDTSARMTGECVSFEGYLHRRSISLVAEPLEIVIDDRLDAQGPCDCIDAYLHLAPGSTPRPSGESEFTIERPQAIPVLVSAEGFDTITVVDSSHSPSYGVSLNTHALRFTVNGARAETRIRIRPVG